LDISHGRATERGADDYLRAQHRIAMLFEALGRAPVDGEARGALAARALRVVARHAPARQELERHRRKLSEAGFALTLPEIFDLVADAQPGWCPWMEVYGVVRRSGHAAGAALSRLVSEADGQHEKSKRFAELARAAARQITRGSIGRAAAVLVEADRLTTEAVVTPDGVQAARAGGLEGQDLEIFRPFIGARYAREPLRRVLSFFRALRPITLLQSLAREPRRDRRHLILGLLEGHGLPTRREALDLLRSDFQDVMSEEEGYVRRNLIYLLRRVPRLDETGLDEEISILARHAAVHQPGLVVKEAIAALGQIPGRRAERVLVKLRDELEKEVGKVWYPGFQEEMRTYLDRIEAALARRDTGPSGGLRATGAPPATGAENGALPDDALPGLFFELSQAAASGILMIEDRSRVPLATYALLEGKLLSARAGELTGADAVYSLLETFPGGTYAWRPQAGPRESSRGEPDPIGLDELVREGLWRCDELALCRDLVPDLATFRGSLAVPKPFTDEKDGLLTRDVWAAASTGVPPLACEKQTPSDPYRVRRLYAHWVDEGALEGGLG